MRLIIIILTMFSFTVYGQTNSNRLRTLKYGGTFSFNRGKNNASGTILIYPETDTTVLFCIDLNKGAPSYNMGFLYSRLKINNRQGTYESEDKGCQWGIIFSKNKLTITTVKGLRDCGFGHDVFADGAYKQISTKIPDHFVNPEGTTYFFKTTAPEKYGSE
jgi:hypothetical protein